MRLIWVDAQLPPSLARWIVQQFGFECAHVSTLGLLGAADIEIARAAAAAGAIVLTKDSDFSGLSGLDPRPRVIWIRIGNSTNAVLRDHLEVTLSTALDELDRGATVVQI